VIEPGLIKTAFGDTAAGHAESTVPAGSPYAAFNEGVVKRTQASYEGPMSMFAAGPDAVAEVVERVAAAARPRPRYIVTAGGRAIRATRALLPDQAWDLLMRTQFPQPHAG